MVRSVAGNLPEQVKNNQSVNTAAGNGGQKMSQYSWFTVYAIMLGDYKTNHLRKGRWKCIWIEKAVGILRRLKDKR